MKVFSILSVFLFCNLAFTGVRVVGDGGGFIENQALFVWQDLPSTLQRCLSIPECHTNQSTADFLRQVLHHVETHQLRLSLAHVEAVPSLKGHLSLLMPAPEGENILTVNLTQLFILYPQPLEFHLSSALSLFIEGLKLLAYDPAQIDFSQLADNIFRFAYAQESNFSVGAFGLPNLYFKIFGNNSQQLFVSDEIGIIDFGMTIKDQLPCSHEQIALNRFRSLKLIGYNPKQGLALEVKVDYSCREVQRVSSIYAFCQVAYLPPANLRPNSAMVLPPLRVLNFDPSCKFSVIPTGL